jgi:hypothetical protein
MAPLFVFPASAESSYVNGAIVAGTGGKPLSQTKEERIMRKEIKEEALDEDSIDNTIEDSFPASDPPSWTAGRRHKPAQQPQEPTLRRFIAPVLYGLAGLSVVLGTLWWLQRHND